MSDISNNKIDIQKYYRDVLAHGLRPDGRKLEEFRPMSVNLKSLHNADGSAIVKIGNTAVICGIKAELAQPKADTPDQGYLIPNVELPPLCSSQYQPGPPSDAAQVAARFLDETLKNACCINLQELCIVPDILTWVLHLDVICLNQDGALLDACVTAAVVALKTVTLPHVEYNAKNNDKIVDVNIQKSLNVNSFPVATSFAIFNEDRILSDPTAEEESLSTGILTVVIQAESNETCGIHQPGSNPLKPEDIKICILQAQNKTKSVAELISVAKANPER